MPPVARHRIVHVCHQPSPAHQALGSEPRDIAAEQERQGHAVTFFNVEGAQAHQDSLRSIDAALEAADIVHVHGPETSTLFPQMARRHRGKRLVASIYADDRGGRAASATRRLRARWTTRHYGHIALAGDGARSAYHDCRRHGLTELQVRSVPLPTLVENLVAVYDSVQGQRARTILGARIAVTDEAGVTAALDDSVESRGTCRLAFVNANLGYACATVRRVADALAGFTLINDGVGIDMASRLLYGRAFVQNLSGTDFVPSYLSRSRHRLRLFLLGTRTPVLEKARAEIERRWPRHQIVGVQHGFFTDAETPSIRDRIARLRADIVLVAMGNPRQELWVAENIPSAAPVAVCVGALFDFIAGEVQRAPHWMRSARLEWLYRLTQEPQRLWRRYTVDGLCFAVQVTRQYLSGARS